MNKLRRYLLLAWIVSGLGCGPLAADSGTSESLCENPDRSLDVQLMAGQPYRSAICASGESAAHSIWGVEGMGTAMLTVRHGGGSALNIQHREFWDNPPTAPGPERQVQEGESVTLTSGETTTFVVGSVAWRGQQLVVTGDGAASYEILATFEPARFEVEGTTGGLEPGIPTEGRVTDGTDTDVFVATARDGDAHVAFDVTFLSGKAREMVVLHAMDTEGAPDQRFTIGVGETLRMRRGTALDRAHTVTLSTNSLDANYRVETVFGRRLWEHEYGKNRVGVVIRNPLFDGATMQGEIAAGDDVDYFEIVRPEGSGANHLALILSHEGGSGDAPLLVEKTGDSTELERLVVAPATTDVLRLGTQIGMSHAFQISRQGASDVPIPYTISTAYGAEFVELDWMKDRVGVVVGYVPPLRQPVYGMLGRDTDIDYFDALAPSGATEMVIEMAPQGGKSIVVRNSLIEPIEVGPEGATVRVPVVEGNAYRAEFSIPSGAVVPIHYAVTFDFD